MPSALQQTFEAGTNGVAISAANSAASGLAATPVLIGAGASATYTTVVGERIDGSVSAKCVGASGETSYLNFSAGASKGGFFAKLRLEDLAAQQPIHIVRGSAKIGQISLNANGSVRFENSNNTQFYTTSVLTLPGVYWLDMAWDTGTSSADGKLKFAIYNSSGALAGGLTGPVEFTGTNAGGGIDSTFCQVGKANGAATAATLIIDEARFLLGVYQFARTLTSPPVADAGPDVTGVEPGETFELDGSGSSALSSITAYAWTPSAGNPVAAPLDVDDAVTAIGTGVATLDGVDLDYELVVTDDLAQDSDPDTVGVSVYMVTERGALDGAMVPVIIRGASPV